MWWLPRSSCSTCCGPRPCHCCHPRCRTRRRWSPRNERLLSLLPLLPLGYTDAAVADELDISVRTVRRMVSGLMNRLGARSRFMAGVKAADRGWLLKRRSEHGHPNSLRRPGKLTCRNHTRSATTALASMCSPGQLPAPPVQSCAALRCRGQCTVTCLAVTNSWPAVPSPHTSSPSSSSCGSTISPSLSTIVS